MLALLPNVLAAGTTVLSVLVVGLPHCREGCANLDTHVLAAVTTVLVVALSTVCWDSAVRWENYVIFPGTSGPPDIRGGGQNNQRPPAHSPTNQRSSAHSITNQKSSEHSATNQRSPAHSATNQRSPAHSITNQRSLHLRPPIRDILNIRPQIRAYQPIW